MTFINPRRLPLLLALLASFWLAACGGGGGGGGGDAAVADGSTSSGGGTTGGTSTGGASSGGNTTGGSSTGGTQTGGTSTGGTSAPSTGSAAVSLPVMTASHVTSRTNCVAPCAVYFDAQTTTSMLTSHPFHELLYQWDFDDAISGGAGTCTDGNPNAREAEQGSYCTGAVTGTQLDSKNYAEGPQAAHVFENAGTFTVILTVSQGDSNFNNNLDVDEFRRVTITITVGDPNIVFAGSTVCIANGTIPTGGSGGCPAGAYGVNANAASNTIENALATGCGGAGCRRILFRRGDTFSVGSIVTIGTAGPGMIGAYGPSGNKPVFASTGSQFRYEADDWRFVDIRQEMGNTGDAAGVYSLGGTTPRRNVLLLRVDTRGGQAFQTAGSTLGGGNMTGMWDGVFVFDSTCKDLQHAAANGDNCYFLSGYRVAVIGNHIDMDSWSEHGIRTYSQRSVISHNTVEDIASGRASITQRSFDWAGGGGVPAGTYSGIGVQSLNRDTGNGAGGGIGQGATNNLIDGRCKDIIFERNYLINNKISTGCETGNTLRNNLFRMATDGVGAIEIGSTDVLGRPSPTNIFIYNNTAFSNLSSDFRMLLAGIGWTTISTSNIYFRNNLAYAPNDFTYDAGTITSFSPVVISSCATGCSTSNSGELQVSPLFSVALPSAIAHFKPQSASYANGRGSSVPVWNDFYGNWQPISRDIGAMVH